MVGPKSTQTRVVGDNNRYYNCNHSMMLIWVAQYTPNVSTVIF